MNEDYTSKLEERIKELEHQNEQLQKDFEVSKKNEDRAQEIGETLRSISNRFIRAVDIDQAIHDSLADMGRLSGAGRAYLFLFSEDGKIMDNTHEWCAKGVKPEINNLKNLSTASFPWWMEKLSKGENIHIKNVSNMPEEAEVEKEFLESQDIKSLMVLPVYTGNQIRGFTGFDDVSKAGDWTREHTTMLQAFSQIIINALQRKRSEENFKNLYEHIPDVVYFLDKEGIMREINQAVKFFTGFDKEELIGTHFENLSFISEEGREKLKELLKRRRRGDELPPHLQPPFTITYKTKSGEFRYGEINEALIPGTRQGMGVIRDVTARIKVEEALSEGTKAQRVLLDNIPTHIWYFMDEKTYGIVNKAHAEFYGVSKEYLSYKNLYEIFPPKEAENCISGNLEVFSSRAPIKKEKWISNAFGEERLLSVAKTPKIDEQGDVEYVVCSAEDITESTRAKEELKKAKEKAEESDRLKSAFLANMSHEIRTPMNAILGFSQMLKDKDYPRDKQKTFLDIIHTRTQHLLSLIDDLVDISKIEADQLSLEIQDFYLNDMMQELYSIYSNELENSEKVHIQLKFNLGLNHEESYIGSDPSQFKRIIDNLLDNAIKFTHKGAVEFGYEPWYDGTLLFYVKDSGIGIPNDQHEHIFERFRQVDDSIARKYGGAGLGLTVSKDLVELFGGKIWVDSREEEGSVFYFTLPYEEQSSKQNEKEKEAEEGISNWGGKTLLLIEDDPASCKYMQELLEPNGLTLITCKTGKEGYEAFINNPDIDLILMDIKLPDTDGLELTRKIRALSANKDVPVIAQTAYAMSGDAKKSLEAGCNDYISKPADSNKLLEKIGKFI